MKSIVCTAFGPVDSLQLQQLRSPEPTDGEVLIGVHAAGVNFPDGLIVEGRYQTRHALPFTPGSEVAGVVAAVGRGVTGFKPGDRVAAFTGIGGFGEQVAVSCEQTYAVPETVADVHAAGCLVAYGTAFHALQDRAHIQAGETLLVLGAAGGVGLAAVQLGRLLGARVIAVASTQDKRLLCRDSGAHEAIGYDDLRGSIKALTDKQGVDVVCDPVGGDNSVAAVKSLAWGGRHLVIGFAAGDIPKVPVNLLLLKSADVQGVLWGAALKRDPVAHAANIRRILEWIGQGRLHPNIETTYPLERSAEAIAHVMHRRARGKVVITVTSRQEAP